MQKPSQMGKPMFRGHPPRFVGYDKGRLPRRAKTCKITHCRDDQLPGGFLCFSHEMQYVIKYGRPSKGDARICPGRLLNAV